MTRAKPKRAGTRSGASAGKRSRPPLPDDLPDAAEAALDDLLSTAALQPLDEADEQPKRQAVATSEVAIDELIPIDDEEPEEPLASPPSRRLPSRVAPLASTVAQPTVASPSRGPAAAPAASAPGPSSRATPLPAPTRATPVPAPSRAVHRVPAPRPTPSPAAHFDQSTDVERPESASPVDEDSLVDESPTVSLSALRFAVYEESTHLASAQGAIAAAGHIVVVGASGREGASHVIDAIRTGAVDCVLVGLPGGEAIIDAAIAQEPHRPTVIAASSGTAVDAVARANAAGADLGTPRPHDFNRIAPLALAAARLDAERRIAAIARGAEQVLRQRLEDLADAEPGGLLPFEMFQRVLELEIKRAKRFEYPLSVALFAVDIPPPPPPAGIRGILRARAGNALINTIRDIDMATQLDHERFLVLLPYTDLTGSAIVGRRVIASVAAGDPVISAGRTFLPRLVGAVAGMRKGEAVSFARLMKNATRALEQARRDGAELAVQP